MLIRILFYFCICWELSSGITCLDCKHVVVQCNATTCRVVECEQVVDCQGSCVLNLQYQGQIPKTGIATCMPGFKAPAEDVLDQREIGNFCVQARDAIHDDEGNLTVSHCMCQSDRCNSFMIFSEDEIEEKPEEKPAEIEDIWNVVYIVCAIVVVFAIVSVLFVATYCWRSNKKSREKHLLDKTRHEQLSSDSCSLLEGGWDESGKHSCSTYKYSTSLSSQYSRGSKGNAVNQNDQHLPIELEKIIGRGRYADVWKGKLRQEKEASKDISVKVFKLPNYGAWRQEKEILSEKWMKHENLIEYYASEQHSKRGLQYWLITDYYGRGNLQDFLKNSTLKWNEFCDMAASIANGLTYLHSEQDDEGRQKLPVAHRDIKSCNILVKNDRVSCVLADFGLSLKLDPTLTQEELANAGQVGTSRYMAPELLERLVNLADIEMFKRVDMYAFALVMWELATRCEVFPGIVQPYQPPYGDRIPDHPTKEQILLHVCRSKQRPTIRREWEKHMGLSKYVATMIKCWDREPEARLTASCVYQRIAKIRNDDALTELPLSPAKEEEAFEKEHLVVVRNDIAQLTELISTVV